MQKQSSPAALAAQKSYRAALEKAFASGRLDELAKTLNGSSEKPSGPADGAPTAPRKTEVHEAAPVETERELLPAAPATPKDPERENRMKLLARIKEAEGREPITRTVDAFLARYPKLPDDFEVLTKVLGHRSDDRVQLSLEQLAKLCDREKPRRGRVLVAQLRMLEDTHGDPAIRSLAAAVRAKL